MGWLDRVFGNDKDRFGQTVIRHFKKKGWTQPLTYDRAGFALLVGQDQRLFLQNSHADWQKAEDKSALLDHLLNMVLEMTQARIDMDDLDAVSPLLLPSLRHRGFMENMWMQEGLGDDPPTYKMAQKPFCEHMSEILIVDSPYSIATCSDHTLQQWGRTFEEMRYVALHNLRQQKPVRFALQDEGFYVSDSGDYLDASLLLMPDAFTHLDLKGHPVAIVASRSLVFTAGSEEAEALRHMAKVALNIFLEETRPIACAPVMLLNGEWQLIEDFSGPLAALKPLKTEQVLFDYRDQHFALARYMERTGRDVFIADILTFQEEESEDQTLLASLVWDVSALMPKVDAFVVQGPEGGTPILRSWAQVMEVCGEKPIEPDTYPARYLFADGISPAQWARLKNDYPHPAEFIHIQIPE